MKKAKTSGRRVLVLGDGIVGATTAYAQAKRGFEVIVIERQDSVRPRNLLCRWQPDHGPSQGSAWTTVEAPEMVRPRGGALPRPPWCSAGHDYGRHQRLGGVATSSTLARRRLFCR
ncbi:MAG: FAD-dependent oxidoreductase [Geminicoccales bacterium]